MKNLEALLAQQWRDYRTEANEDIGKKLIRVNPLGAALLLLKSVDPMREKCLNIHDVKVEVGSTLQIVVTGIQALPRVREFEFDAGDINTAKDCLALCKPHAPSAIPSQTRTNKTTSMTSSSEVPGGDEKPEGCIPIVFLQALENLVASSAERSN